MKNYRNSGKATILFASILLITGVLSSFKSNGISQVNVVETETYVPTDTETFTDTDTGTAPESNKTRTEVNCSVYVNCPNGERIKSDGKQYQCLGNTGNCQPKDEASCNAATPRCP